MLVPDAQVVDWNDLQNRVKVFFCEMGYEASSPHVVELAGRGRKEVDVYVEDKRQSVTMRILIECKWWEQSVPQEVVHSFHTVMQGSGANTGFIVSKVGFQQGALEAIKYTNINLVTFEELQHAYGDEWFRHQHALIAPLEQKLREFHRLHLDQFSLLPIHNNHVFHTPELTERFFKLAAVSGNLISECHSCWPESYKGPEPVKMGIDPLNWSAEPPPGKHWHEAPTVRDYFARLIEGLRKWIADFDLLSEQARRSFDNLPEVEQDEHFSAVMLGVLEETPVRVLKRHLDGAEYHKLLKLLRQGVVSQFFEVPPGPVEPGQQSKAD